jgi:hypothetical protein
VTVSDGSKMQPLFFVSTFNEGIDGYVGGFVAAHQTDNALSVGQFEQFVDRVRMALPAIPRKPGLAAGSPPLEAANPPGSTPPPSTGGARPTVS